MRLRLGYSNLYWINKRNKELESKHATETRSPTQSSGVQNQTPHDQPREGEFRGISSPNRDERLNVQRIESGVRDRGGVDQNADKGQRRSLEEPRLLRRGESSEDSVQEHECEPKEQQHVRDGRNAFHKGRGKARRS